jgi:hypothetical protein
VRLKQFYYFFNNQSEKKKHDQINNAEHRFSNTLSIRNTADQWSVKINSTDLERKSWYQTHVFILPAIGGEKSIVDKYQKFEASL